MSADCEQVQEKIAAYVDRELAGADHAQIAAHLEQCLECAETVVVQQLVKKNLHAQTQGRPAPFYLRARIRRNLEGAGLGAAVKHIFDFYPGRAWTALAGAAAVIMIAMMLGGRLWASLADPIAYHAEAVIIGRIICADCTLMQKTQITAPHTSGHHLVIQTQEGKIWTVVLSPTGQELLQKTDIASHRVQARGYAFPRVGYIQVTDFQISQN